MNEGINVQESPSLPPWLRRWLLNTWVNLFLLGGIAAVMAYSFDQAGWVSDDSAVLWSIFFGLIIGWWLALSRFKIWFVLAYSLVLPVATIFMLMGKLLGLLPLLFTTPALDVLTTANARIWTVMWRAQSWISAITTGGSVSDSGLFVFLASFLVWNAAAWLAWATLRRRAFEGILVVGVLLAANVALGRKVTVDFWLFVILAVFLMVRNSYKTNQREWDRRGVDYPDSVDAEWVSVGFLLTFFISAAALLATIFGTPEGWQAISKAMRPVKADAETTTQRLFTGVKPPVGVEPVVHVRIPDMTSFGYPLPQGSDSMFWVKTSDPAPPPLEARAASADIPHHYWRSTIYTEYTPDGWKIGGGFDDPPAAVEVQQPPPGRYPLKQEFEMVAVNSGNQFSANQPVETGSNVQLRARKADETQIVTGSATSYSVISWATQVSADELQAAPAVYPAEIAKTYLQVPVSVPARVKRLSDQLTAGDANPYQKALKLQTYLRQNYTYRQDVKPPEKGKDYVDNFLFETQAGYCSHFATSMVVMLRLEGVPARVAAGYATGEYDREKGAYLVTASNAHAWVEVYFPGYSWVEFDPTPSQSAFVYKSTGQTIKPQVSPQALEIRTSPTLPRLGWTLAGIAAAGILFVLIYFRFFRKMPAYLAPGETGEFYWRVRRTLGWLGLYEHASATPEEFLERASPMLAGQSRLANVLARLTDQYNRAAFSQQPPQQFEHETAQQQWRRAWKERVSLACKKAAIAIRKNLR